MGTTSTCATWLVCPTVTLKSNTQVLLSRFDNKSGFSYNNGMVTKKGLNVKYTLLTSKGQVYTFFLKTAAEQFQTAYGGVVFSQQILVDDKSALCYN